MGMTNKEILGRLEKLDLLFAELETIPELFPHFVELTKRKKLLQSDCSSPIMSVWNSWKNAPAPEATLTTLEKDIFDLTMTLLSKKAVQLNLNWQHTTFDNLPPVEGNDKEPTLRILPLFKQFSFSTNTTEHQPIEGTESSMAEPVMKKKKKSKVTIAEASSSSSHPSILSQITQLQEQFKTLLEQNKNLFIPEAAKKAPISQDFLIKQFVVEFNELAAKIATFPTLEKRWLSQKNADGLDVENALAELQRDFDSLSTFQVKQEQLIAEIEKRSKVIQPQENLKLHLNNIQTTLKKKLEESVIYLSMLDLTKGTDPTDTKDEASTLNDTEQSKLKEDLIDFINGFFSELEESVLAINRTTSKELRLALLKHMGATSFLERLSSWSRSWLPSSPVEEVADQETRTNNLNQLLGQLFKGNEQVETALPNHIAATHHLLAILESHDIRLLKDEVVLKEMDRALLSAYEQLAKEIKDKQRGLDVLLALFPIEYNKRDEVLKARQLKKKLAELEELAEKLPRAYKETLQGKRENISELRARFVAIEQCQQDYNSFLEDLRKQFENPEDNECFMNLNKLYQLEKHELFSKLDRVIKEAEQALIVFNDLDGEEKPKLGVETQKANLEHLKNASEENIQTLAKKSNSDIRSLSLMIQQVRDKIRAIHGDDISKIELSQTRFVNSSEPLSDDNPLKDRLPRAISNAETSVRALKEHYLKLDTIKGSELGTWLDELKTKKEAAKTAVEKRDRIFLDTMTLEARLKSTAYTTSLDILEKIEEEFNRIYIKYGQQNSENDPVESPLMREKNTVLLNQIDPRLSYLFDIYHDFKRINARFINADVSLCLEPNYIQELLDQVNQHIHHDNMENFSEGLLNIFIQLIRKYIIKPLQNINDSSSTMNRSYKVTFWASKTERTAVKLGNKAHQALDAELQAAQEVAANLPPRAAAVM